MRANKLAHPESFCPCQGFGGAARLLARSPGARPGVAGPGRAAASQVSRRPRRSRLHACDSCGFLGCSLPSLASVSSSPAPRRAVDSSASRAAAPALFASALRVALRAAQVCLLLSVLPLSPALPCLSCLIVVLRLCCSPPSQPPPSPSPESPSSAAARRESLVDIRRALTLLIQCIDAAVATGALVCPSSPPVIPTPSPPPLAHIHPNQRAPPLQPCLLVLTARPSSLAGLSSRLISPPSSSSTSSCTNILSSPSQSLAPYSPLLVLECRILMPPNLSSPPYISTSCTNTHFSHPPPPP